MLLACAAASKAQQLTLNRLVVGPPAAGHSRIYVSTTGTPHPQAGWKLSAIKTANSTPIPIAVTNVIRYPSSSTVALEFDPSPLAGRDPRRYGWTAVYNDLLTVTLPPPEELFGIPKSRDDADLYLFGSYLAGVSTKPLYSIDAQLRWLTEIHESGYFLGISSTVAINSSASLPVDQTRADPDSIAAAMSLRFMKRAFLFQIDPAKGEFARQYPASSFVPSAMVKWVRDPLLSRPRHAAVFYPSAGFETGANLNQPRSLFGQPVDLSRYGAIGRFVLRGYGAYYISKSHPDNDDPYLFEFFADYTARLLLTDEPFITTESVEGVKQPVFRLESGARQYLESGIAWNASQRFGVEAKYRHGSLPPMFEFVDHQVSLGITFKTKLPTHF
jgi:hypothetical protein